MAFFWQQQEAKRPYIMYKTMETLTMEWTQPPRRRRSSSWSSGRTGHTSTTPGSHIKHWRNRKSTVWRSWTTTSKSRTRSESGRSTCSYVIRHIQTELLSQKELIRATNFVDQNVNLVNFCFKQERSSNAWRYWLFWMSAGNGTGVVPATYACGKNYWWALQCAEIIQIKHKNLTV